MMKRQLLQKKMIKVGIIATVLLCVSGAATYAVFQWSSSLQNEARTTKGRLSRSQSDLRSLEQKNTEAQEYLELYRQITGDSENEKISDLDREKIEEWVKQAARQHYIFNLQGEISPIEAVSNPAFRKKTFEGINSRVTLRFSAMTDEQAFLFAESIVKDFPGYIKILRFNLTKKGEITNGVLENINRGSISGLVDGELEFVWIGVRESEGSSNEPRSSSSPRSTPAVGGMGGIGGGGAMGGMDGGMAW